MVNLTHFREIVLNPLYSAWDVFIEILPSMLWFIIIVILGYFLASFIGWITKKLLHKLRIDKRLRRLDLQDSLGRLSIAKLSGMLVKWYFFFQIILVPSLRIFESNAFMDLASRIVVWIPKLILAVAAIMVSLLAIDFIIHKLLETKNQYIRVIANVIKAILVIVVVFTAIEQLGIKTELAQNIFLMFVAAILITVALAFGIGFGFSLKEELKPVIRKYKKKLL